jgi:single-stranded DNA-binding protein
MNLGIYIGNFVRDPQLRTVNDKDGKPVSVVNFTLAINGRKGDEATFLDFEAWAQGADTIAKWFKKGHPIVIRDSEARNERWKDKNTGEDRSRVKFRVNRFEFVPFKPKGETEDGSTPVQPAPAEEEALPPKPARRPPVIPRSRQRETVPADEEDSDIPFDVTP